jgi:hypothetical protein
LFDSDVEIFFMGFKDSGGTATSGGSGVDKSMKRRYFIGDWGKK